MNDILKQVVSVLILTSHLFLLLIVYCLTVCVCVDLCNLILSYLSCTVLNNVCNYFSCYTCDYTIYIHSVIYLHEDMYDTVT